MLKSFLILSTIVGAGIMVAAFQLPFQTEYTSPAQAVPQVASPAIQELTAKPTQICPISQDVLVGEFSYEFRYLVGIPYVGYPGCEQNPPAGTKYLGLFYKVKSRDSEPISVRSGGMRLKTPDGLVYSPQWDFVPSAFTSGDNMDRFSNTLQPRIDKEMFLLFQVPESFSEHNFSILTDGGEVVVSEHEVTKTIN